MSLRPIIIGNWKMHTTLAEAMVLAERVRTGVENVHEVDVVICPPAIWLYPIAESYQRGTPDNLFLGAQNVSWHEQGAYTGEISVTMVKSLVNCVLIGHSEQVEHFGLDEEKIALTAQLVLKTGLTPVVIVGEPKKSDHSARYVINRLRRLLVHIPKSAYAKIIVAYEPVWAIGTGKAATGAYAGLVCGLIKDLVGERTRVIYGGSTHAGNVKEFALQPAIDGILPGSGSLKASDFLKMAKQLTVAR